MAVQVFVPSVQTYTSVPRCKLMDTHQGCLIYHESPPLLSQPFRDKADLLQRMANIFCLILEPLAARF